jgi:hypothetical protein
MSWRTASTSAEILKIDHTFSTTMSASSIRVTAVPRFLQPQISWSGRAVRPAALGAPEARRHRSSLAHKQYAATPITKALQQQCVPQGRRTAPQYASGYPSALELHRHFSATAAQQRDHHFDTLKFVQRLKDEGFTEEQAEGMMRILGDVIEERYDTA